MSAVNNKKASVAASDHIAHSAVDESMVNFKLPECCFCDACIVIGLGAIRCEIRVCDESEFIFRFAIVKMSGDLVAISFMVVFSYVMLVKKNKTCIFQKSALCFVIRFGAVVEKNHFTLIAAIVTARGFFVYNRNGFENIVHIITCR